MTSASRRSPIAAVVGSPLLWGGLVTWAFYAALPHIPVQNDFLTRYFCGHPLAYVTAALFFVGMAILATRLLELLAERVVWGTKLVSDLERLFGRPADDVSLRMSERVSLLPARLQQSTLAARARDVAQYVSARRSAEGLDAHLKYLAELASERLHSSFALVRTITWAVPILGFLGTVIGITIAIANVTPQQLETSLAEVTGGLAVAFDTTALALGLSLVLVFAAFVVERSLASELDRVEEYAVNRLAALFPGASTKADPLLDAQSESAQKLLGMTEHLMRHHAAEWDSSLSELRQRWQIAITEQQQTLAASLTGGLDQALTGHASELRDAKETFQQTLAGLWSSMREELGRFRDEQQHQADAFLASARQSLAEMVTLSQQLRELAGDQSQLQTLRTQLDQNLDALRVADRLEETLHSLTAAVHLLTTKASHRAA